MQTPSPDAASATAPTAVAIREPSRPAPASAPASAGWRASLELEVRTGSRRSQLGGVRHSGPLRVQKPFHPEANGTCHIYVLHPPGGVAGGDELWTDVTVGPGARALVTSPAAQKLYRCLDAPSAQQIQLRVRSGHLEWLPQETIAFSGARSRTQLHLDLDADAGFIGWDILCLGRPACSERFEAGQLDQSIEVQRAGTPLWLERLRIVPGDPLLEAPWGLRGCSTIATLLCSPAVPEHLDEVRDAVRLEPGEHFAVTAPRGLIVCRFLGHRAYRARQVLESAWNLLRPAVIGSQARPPRIWAT